MSFDLDQMTVLADPTQSSCKDMCSFGPGTRRHHRADATIPRNRTVSISHLSRHAFRPGAESLAPPVQDFTPRFRARRAHAWRHFARRRRQSGEPRRGLLADLRRGRVSQRDRLQPHAPGEELVDKYVRYVNAVLSAHDPRLDRYLSKNNNNILRLGIIHRAFPNALILIPFRAPLQHAHSLLRQHLRFSELQAKREFVLSYMTWLGHHEFGLDHRPFKFEGAGPVLCSQHVGLLVAVCGARRIHGSSARNPSLHCSYPTRSFALVRRLGNGLRSSGVPRGHMSLASH